MCSCKKLIWILSIFITLSVFTYSPGVAADVPPGFYLVQSKDGVQLYRKDYPGGAPDFVQVVDLSMGAALKPLHGAISDPGTGQGVYEGNDAHFRSRSLSDYWRTFSTENPSAFCVTNGQFFYMPEYPTRLPFPLKVDGDLLTDGYGIKDFPGKKLILELWPGKADIISLSKEALLNSTAPDIVAGLTEDAPKRIKFAVGRTFVGVADKNVNGTYETVLVFNSSISHQDAAANVLRNFGAEKVMMLDGGGSTQLSCQGKSYIYSDRLIPQAIGIMAAPAGAAIKPTTLAPPSRELNTSPGLLAAGPPDKGTADFQEILPTASAIDQVQKPTEVSSQNVPQQPSLTPTSQSDPTSTPEVTTDTGQAVNQNQRQDTQALIAEPVANPNSAIRQSTQNQIALPLIEANGFETKNGTGRALVSGITPPAQKSHPQTGEPIQIVDIVWVPLSMSPVLLLVLIMVHKIRSPHG